MWRWRGEVRMTDDAQRVLDDYGPMTDAYADDADHGPVQVAYDRPTILSMAGDVRGQRILDVGCAAGALAEVLVERGAEVVGVDLNQRFIELARIRLGGRATFHVADISASLPFVETGAFDIVVASLVLHYLRDWGPPLRELARALRPGGLLLVSTHHPTRDMVLADPEASYFETLLLTDTWDKGGREHTVRFYHRPLSAIADALADAGFLIERIPEPIPDRSAFAGIEAFYEQMIKGPHFLFVRAIKHP
jgi:SAM-dependent methyltransferase